MILLCLLSLFYDHFIDILLYERDSLSSKEVKAFLNSMELKNKCLIIRSRINNKGYGRGGKYKSKLKYINIKCFKYYEVQKKNLNSLSLLNSVGFGYSNKSGVLRVLLSL